MKRILKSIFHLIPSSFKTSFEAAYYLRKLESISIDKEPDLQIIDKLLRPGNNAVDIGANYGLYSFYLSNLVGEKGIIHSFEPVGRTHRILKYNLPNFPHYNIILHQMALAEKAGEAHMLIPEYQGGGENYYEARLNSESGEGEKVSVDSLDNILPYDFSADFVKIDTEGNEFEVLQGAKQTLTKSSPALLVEINGGIHRGNQNALNIVEFLETFDYQPYHREGDKLSRVSEHRGFNYFFLTKNHLEKYRELVID